MSEWREATPPASVTDAGEVTEIERQIERTQGALSGTLDAIQEKLNPGALMEQARGPVEDTSDHIVAAVQRAVRESADHIVDRATEVLRDAPGPLLAQVRGPVEEMGDHLIARITAAAEEATDHILAQARTTATEAASDIVARTGEAVRAATIGKVEHMVQTVGETTRDMAEGANDTTKGLGSAILGTIEQNPLPAALAALGLGWLYLKRPKGAAGSAASRPAPSYRAGQTGYAPSPPGVTAVRPGATGQHGVGDTVGGAAGAVGDAIGGAAGAMGDTVGTAASTVGDAVGGAAGAVGDAVGGTAGAVGSALGSTAGAVGDTAGHMAEGTQDRAQGLVAGTRHQAQRLGSGFQTLAQQNPLALGAAGLALGSLIAFAVPETPGERQLLGGVRDTVMDKAAETTQETLDKVGTIASEAGSTAAQEARKEGLLS